MIQCTTQVFMLVQISEAALEAQAPHHSPIIDKAVMKPAKGAHSLLRKLLRQWRGVRLHCLICLCI